MTGFPDNRLSRVVRSVVSGLASVLLLGVALPAAGLAQPGVLRSLPAGTEARDLSAFSRDSALERARLLETRNVELLGTGAVDPETYVLGPGDLLGVEVRGAFSMSAEDLVSADGLVTFSQLGTLELAGLTLAQAREVVAERGGGLIRGSEVRLVLKSTRAFKVFVVGAVGEPGAVRATAVMRVSEALEAAGGLAPGGDLRAIQLIHTDGATRSVDLVPFLFEGITEGNPTLLDGVTLLVRPVNEQFGAYGAVLRPGSYSVIEGDDLAGVLRWIGVAATADSSEVVIQRFPAHADWEVLRFDLRKVLAGSENLSLQANDRILIRFRSDWLPEQSVRVIGAVRRPGPVPVRRGQVRVADVLELAGGPLEDAVLQRVVVGRPHEPDTVRVTDPTSSRGFLENLSSYRFLESVVDLTQGPGPFLAPGDVVSVPRDTRVVQVLGQVKIPGFYDFMPEWRPQDYVEAAGGWGQQADKGQTRITRGPHGQVVFASDIRSVAPGDVIWIPEKRQGDFWRTVRDVSTLVLSLATLYLLIEQARSN